jgi:hypothetical protein
MIALLLFMLSMLLMETAPDTDEEETEEETEGQEDEEEQETEEDDDEVIRDPKAMIKSLRSANDRLAKKLERLSAGESLTASRVEAAFLRCVLERNEPIDIETAFDLFIVRGFGDAVKVDDEGNVEGMQDAFGKLLRRYPWLAEDGAAPDAPERPSKISGRPIGGTKKRDPSATQMSQASLEKRFKALRK